MEITLYKYQTDAMSMKAYGIAYYAQYGEDDSVSQCMRQWAISVIGFGA